jgi:hypothetical protein
MSEMKNIIHLAMLLFLTIGISSCNEKPPDACDCAKNEIRRETKNFNTALQKKCDNHYDKLNKNAKRQWENQIQSCLDKDPFYIKLMTEKKQKAYQSPEYLFGLWSTVANGIGIRLKIMPGNMYYWQDDLNGFSSGTYQGNNSNLTFYERGFPTGNGYINEKGQLVHSVAGMMIIFAKE